MQQQIPSGIVDTDVFLAWVILTVATVILLSLVYRAVARSAPKPGDFTPVPPSPVPLQKPRLYISADVDEAYSLLNRSVDDINDGFFNSAAEKAYQAATNVLSQLLRYFSVEAEGMSIMQMLKTLHDKGALLRPHAGLERVDEILEKKHQGKSLSREETHWVVHIAHFLIETSKEVPVKD
ncbi:MAG: hypothetical protein M1503_03435 [Thaumarchaeota archaeon]|nr:hypothetical protein [Nitrososphaerota archaeon]MCL5317306.1 hypothetical protein [Nitrososphaerota archaeon]